MVTNKKTTGKTTRDAIDVFVLVWMCRDQQDILKEIREEICLL